VFTDYPHQGQRRLDRRRQGGRRQSLPERVQDERDLAPGKALEFLFFDLSSCVEPPDSTPVPPVPQPPGTTTGPPGPTGKTTRGSSAASSAAAPDPG
jgi:hypothetical protein